LLLYSDGSGAKAEKLAKDLAQALLDAKGSGEALEIKDRDHGTLLSKISADEPAGAAILAFVRKNAAK
jgi:hypothetical protein